VASRAIGLPKYRKTGEKWKRALQFLLVRLEDRINRQYPLALTQLSEPIRDKKWITSMALKWGGVLV
jgi:hypothetical protein